MTEDEIPPEWLTSQWLNSPTPLSLGTLRGRVIMMVAFQMLCPGCVSTALPQLMRVRAAFPEKDLAVVGLHSVFEHHAAQGHAAALEAFLHEYRITIPVGIDAQGAADGLPMTMQAYAMRGTPTMLVYDRRGQLQVNHFGHVEDIRLGAILAQLVMGAG